MASKFLVILSDEYDIEVVSEVVISCIGDNDNPTADDVSQWLTSGNRVRVYQVKSN